MNIFFLFIIIITKKIVILPENSNIINQYIENNIFSIKEILNYEIIFLLILIIYNLILYKLEYNEKINYEKSKFSIIFLIIIKIIIILFLSIIIFSIILINNIILYIIFPDLNEFVNFLDIQKIIEYTKNNIILFLNYWWNYCILIWLILALLLYFFGWLFIADYWAWIIYITSIIISIIIHKK